VRGLREGTALALVRERASRPFDSVEDLTLRVPELSKRELTMLAQIGALNPLGENFHRRDALWQVERAVRQAGPLFEAVPQSGGTSPLAIMSDEERLVSDFHGTGLTVGRHPMAYRRAELNRKKIKRACELKAVPNGRFARIAGCVIARQRPGTAKGFLFLSLEDETGIANAIVTPDIYERNRSLLTTEKFLMIEGILQNQDNVVSVKARRIHSLSVTAAETTSHDFH
jgi:error-prone DNA polymerase